jgi:hypothetical protein
MGVRTMGLVMFALLASALPAHALVVSALRRGPLRGRARKPAEPPHPEDSLSDRRR